MITVISVSFSHSNAILSLEWPISSTFHFGYQSRKRVFTDFTSCRLSIKFTPSRAMTECRDQTPKRGLKLESENPNHAYLYGEVQESFVSNLARVLRVGGGVTENGKVMSVSKSDLAKSSGLSKGTITKLTSIADCTEAKPDLETLCKVGSAVNVSPAFLLMTRADWDLLFQAFGTLQMVANPNGQRDDLIELLVQAAATQHVDISAARGLEFMRAMKEGELTGEQSLARQRGVLGMTAVLTGAMRRADEPMKMQATALGAVLGDRDVNQK